MLSVCGLLVNYFGLWVILLPEILSFCYVLFILHGAMPLILYVFFLYFFNGSSMVP